MAANYGNEKMTKLLISHGANVDSKDESGRTPLHDAAERGHNDVAQVLVNNGAEVNKRNRDGETPLNKALEGLSSLNAYEFLFMNNTCGNIKASGKDEQQPNYKDVIELLLSNGADANNYGDLSKCSALSPLYMASAIGNYDIVEMLLSYGADVTVGGDKRRRDYSPLHAAVKFGNTKVVELLISHGADVKSKTLLFKAANKDIVKLLLTNGANVNINAKGDRGASPLHEVVFNNKPYKKMMAEMLIAHGANVNAVDNYGSTPLHYAAERGSKALVEVLIDRGANINARDEDNNTALRLAELEGHKDIVKLLRNQGMKK